MIDHPLHVIVKFGSDISGAVQGPALLEFERSLRRLSQQLSTDGKPQWIEVFKETKGDDSKLRSAMTPEQRSRL